MEQSLYVVVRNHDEQYSIWPHGKAIPEGWSVILEGKPKEECLQFIEVHWTDMTPASLRRVL